MDVRSQGRRRGQRGLGLAEFTLVALELFVVMFALVDFARAALVYTGLANASRIAARYAMTHGSDRSQACASSGGCGSTDTTATTTDICGSSGVLASYAFGMDKNKLNCTSSGVGGSPGSTVKITVTYPYDPFFGYLPIKSISLSSTSSAIITY